MKEQTKYYHYTIPSYLKRIIADGKINVARSHISKVKGIAWVSSNPLMENTSLKGCIDVRTGIRTSLDFQGQHETSGCARIQVDPSVLTKWSVLKHKAGYKKAERNFSRALSDELDEIGLDVGADPSEWYGSLYPITEDKFLRFEVWNGSEWVEFTDEYVEPTGVLNQKEADEIIKMSA